MTLRTRPDQPPSMPPAPDAEPRPGDGGERGEAMAVEVIARPMEVRRVALDQIHADPANVNTHDESNLRQIRGSLQEFGQVEPLIVHKATGKVIGGNGRLEVMRELGWTECDIVEVDSDNVHATALGIALNRTAKTSVFDDDALAKTLRALRDEDFDLDAVGFTDAEVDALFGVGADDGTGDGGSGETSNPAEARKSLADRFGVPPFSVLDARQGYWQDRKRAWLALGIQSELGRGGTPEPVGARSTEHLQRPRVDQGQGVDGPGAGRARDASPAGGPRPANATVTGRAFPAAKVTKDADGKWTRGDGQGRALNAQA